MDRSAAGARGAGPRQLAFHGLAASGTHTPGVGPSLGSDLLSDLSEVTFVVVDLETTGGSASDAAITEIGAVKVRAGQTLGEFATFVQPGRPIPAFISALTGIRDLDVADAPGRREVLHSFWEFARGCVLVAHNAPYDVGFLKAACALDDIPWPAPPVLDTAVLARHLLLPGETRNRKLGTLAAHFRAPVVPCHRALDDARATVHVLHCLLERAGTIGASTLEDLRSFTGPTDQRRRAKRHLAHGLPDSPGVYVFLDGTDDALYVGTSRNIRQRVQSYFTAAEKRRRVLEMLSIAARVHPIPCATALEARVREIRALAELSPRYNRRSTRPHTTPWLALTPTGSLRVVSHEALARLRAATSIGPFPSRAAASAAAELVLAVCAAGGRPRSGRSAGQGRDAGEGCDGVGPGQPLRAATAWSSGRAAAHVPDRTACAAVLEGDVRPAAAYASERMTELAELERYERAAVWRDRLAFLRSAVQRAAQVRLLSAAAQIVAAERLDDGGWQIHVIRFGRLAAAGVSPAGDDPRAHMDALRAMAEVVEKPPAAGTSAHIEEVEAVGAWLFSGRARLVECDAALALPAHCGGSFTRPPTAVGLRPASPDPA